MKTQIRARSLALTCLWMRCLGAGSANFSVNLSARTVNTWTFLRFSTFSFVPRRGTPLGPRDRKSSVEQLSGEKTLVEMSVRSPHFHLYFV